MKTVWNWNRFKSIRTAGLLAGVLVSGTAANAAERNAVLMQPAANGSVSSRFNSAEWTAYVADDVKAAPEAKAAAPEAAAGCNECNTCDSCNQGCCCHHSSMGDLCFIDILPSDHCYDCFISPITNPVFFEDPRNLSEARAIFVEHTVPQSALGGDVQVLALQIRARLSDRLSLIATKDGYIFSDNPLIDDGWADVSLGLKYLLYADPGDQVLVSAGAVYELPIGSADAQQANGDGTYDLFLTSGALLANNIHWIGAGGFVLPADDNDNSTWCFISNHFDYYMGRGWYALTEYNWYHYLESGNNANLSIEGGDFFNLGSTNVAGNDIVTGAFGAKYKPDACTEIGIAYELPLTDREDVLKNRLTIDYIKRF